MKTAQILFLVAAIMISSNAAMAQTQTQTRQRFATKAQPADVNKEESAKTPTPAAEPGNVGDVIVAEPAEAKKAEPSDVKKPATDVPDDTQANRHEQVSEEAAVVPYYNNFFNTYRLGPEDVVSVSVFGQDRYSRSGITIPPSGRISLALIPGGECSATAAFFDSSDNVM